MASREVAKQVINRDTRSINGGGCQFPRYAERNGLNVCGYNPNLIVHSIIPPSYQILQHLDPTKKIGNLEQLQLIKIIDELSVNPDRINDYEKIFFKILVLKQFLTNPNNYVLLCPTHHDFIYSRLRDLASTNKRVNWDLYACLSLKLALEGVRYWNWSYDPWFFHRAKLNSDRFYQEKLQEQ